VKDSADASAAIDITKPDSNVNQIEGTTINPDTSTGAEPDSCANQTVDKMCDFIHDSTESRVIGTPISRIRVMQKHRLHDEKPTSQSVFATTLAK
jgi:hypothetical protein